jgi:hypothetical protein
MPIESTGDAIFIKFGVLEVSAFGQLAVAAVIIVALVLVGARLLKGRQ